MNNIKAVFHERNCFHLFYFYVTTQQLQQRVKLKRVFFPRRLMQDRSHAGYFTEALKRQ